MKLYLYKNRGAWCLEDPDTIGGITGLADSVRYRLTEGQWHAEEHVAGIWLDSKDQGEFLRIVGNHDLNAEQVHNKILRFFTRLFWKAA